MKKILVFALISVMLLCLVACGRRNEDNMPADATPESNETTNDIPAVDKNIPDPEVNGNSTDHKDAAGNNDQGGILDDTMDQITGQN